MELEDIKRVWQEMELRQNGMAALWFAEYRERRIDKTRSTLRWSIAAKVGELAIWIIFTAWIASFWIVHRDVTRWLVIGLLLHVYGIAGIWASATQLLLLSRIYLFDAPVLTLQRRLAQLRRFRVWSTLALGLPWWCLWLLVSLVGMYWWTGVDAFVTGTSWIRATLAVGLAGMAVSVWLARRWAGRAIRSPFVQRIVDDMSGCNLARAARQLDELARFDRE